MYAQMRTQHFFYTSSPASSAIIVHFPVLHCLVGLMFPGTPMLQSNFASYRQVVHLILCSLYKRLYMYFIVPFSTIFNLHKAYTYLNSYCATFCHGAVSWGTVIIVLPIWSTLLLHFSRTFTTLQHMHLTTYSRCLPFTYPCSDSAVHYQARIQQLFVGYHSY